MTRKQVQIYIGGTDSEEIYQRIKDKGGKHYLMSLIRKDMEKKGAGNVRS